MIRGGRRSPIALPHSPPSVYGSGLNTQRILVIKFPRYAVYHDLRSRGWVVRSGAPLGADWILYKLGKQADQGCFAPFSLIKDLMHT